MGVEVGAEGGCVQMKLFLQRLLYVLRKLALGIVYTILCLGLFALWMGWAWLYMKLPIEIQQGLGLITATGIVLAVVYTLYQALYPHIYWLFIEPFRKK
jgi:hypothetical protein